MSVATPSVTPVTRRAHGVLGRRRRRRLGEHHRAGVVGRPGTARAGARRLGRRTRGLRAGRAAEPPRRPHPAAGQRAEQSVLGLDAAVQGRDRRRHRGRCAAPTSTARRTRSSTTRSSTSTAAASRPTRSPSAAELQRRGELAADRRRAVPPHPLGQRPDRRQRRLLRRDRAREGDPAPARRRRHQDRRRSATPARARSTTSSTRRRPRSTRSPTSAPREDYAPLSDIMDGVLDEIEAIGNRDGGPVRRARPASPTSTTSPTVCTPAR